jgi:hypothetical protein
MPDVGDQSGTNGVFDTGGSLVSTVFSHVDRPSRCERQQRRAARRQLKRQDTVSSHLAELHAVHDVLERGVEVIDTGWLQHGWFTVMTPEGLRAVTAHNLNDAVDKPVFGACLVGSVVQGAGGPSAVRTQLVQRTLDLVWHTLREDPDRPVRWCSDPRTRTLRVLDLTRWNDSPTRTHGEVVALLLAAQQTANRERDRYRAEQLSLAAGTTRV